MRLIRKKPKPVVTSKTIFAELELLRVGYQKSLKAHRSQLYQVVGNVARIVVRLRENKVLGSGLIKKLIKKRREEGGLKRHGRNAERFDLTTEVMALATGADSRPARQAAWKRARVVDYLIERGVEPDKIAKAISKRGGIERILADASREAPRATGNVREPLARKSSAEQHGIRRDREKSNDGEVSFTISISLSDRDSILELADGAAVAIFAKRVVPGPTVKVQRVQIGEDATDDDWD